MRERVIFDNGGAIIVQLGAWAHYYQDATQAARDVAAWHEDHSTDGWEGHNPYALECDPTDEEIRNGGYRVYDLALDEIKPCGWHNVDDFCAAYSRA